MANITRRGILAAGAATAGTIFFPSHSRALQDEKRVVKKGRLKQSVSKWCFGKIKLPEFSKICAEMGIVAIDLLGARDWAVVQDHGLDVSLGTIGAGGISKGINDKKNHAKIIKAFEENIPKAAKAKVKNVITFYGNRIADMSEEEAIENSIACLQKCKPIAEEHKLPIVVEYLNSKVNHKGYIGDRTSYCVKIVKAVNSPYIKVLYDIYHAQIMEGDIIRTIQQNHAWFGHYHTAGNPGRNEIDDTQELNYPPIAKAVADTGFQGYFAHEFIPKRDPIQSLRQAVALCDV